MFTFMFQSLYVYTSSQVHQWNGRDDFLNVRIKKKSINQHSLGAGESEQLAAVRAGRALLHPARGFD